jgi:Trypsin/Ricin-type beta-trefoil lectin domain-like
MQGCALHSISICLLLCLQIGIAHAQPENIGQSRQELVTPTPPIDQKTQEQFGLLTLSNPEGTCSASMLNDFWAITAAHCVFSTKNNCPQFQPNQISLQANWPGNSKKVQAVQVVTFGVPVQINPLGNPTCASARGVPFDIALLQVGLHDFGRPDVRPMKLDDQRPMNNLTLTAFGRGINALAFQSSAGPVPTQLDGQFRSADFSIISINPDSSDLPVNYAFPGKRGATTAGGDSGGPSYIQDWDDPLSIRRKLEWRLMGVHSFCDQTTCLTGQSCPDSTGNFWTWVSSIQRCWDASTLPVRDRILAAIEAVPPDTGFIGTFPTSSPPSVLSHKRALYAISLDEPLVGPPGAAIDMQLTFKRCHELQIHQGCPVTADLEQWAYDPASHRLFHAASGKCVNISGARHDPGSPIILFPCQNAANEKWTLIEHAGSPIWSIKSDLTGMCLHAQPGRAGGHTPQQLTLPTPASLVQMPCNGGEAQRFTNVDADFARRNGPH